MLESAFLKQADSCEMLGSPFTARILRLLASKPPENGPVWQKIRNWPGDVTATGDAVALRFASALHGLVLEGQSETLASVYPPNHEMVSDEKLWQVIHANVDQHSEYVLERLTRPPQTNVTRRSSAILLGAAEAVRQTGIHRLNTFEVGASAGLNLHWDQNFYDFGGQQWGNSAAPITLTPDCSARFEAFPEIEVISRRGCDLTPLDLTDRKEQLRLMSYVWSDQTDRLSRLKAAIERFAASALKVEKADAVSWLEEVLQEPTDNSIRFVYHTVVAQYFPEEVKQAFELCLQKAGERASKKAPLAWLSMETDGGIEGALLRLTVWPEGRVIDLARVDFHGRWIKPII